MLKSKPFDFESAVARVPRWMLALAVLGTAVAVFLGGPEYGGGFLLGSLGAWANYWFIERAVNRMGQTRRAGGTTPKLLIQFTALLLGAFVILESSGFKLSAALCGFLVCPAAVILEIVYELIAYDHT